MHYSFQLKKFFYSHHFFGGMRIALGIALPAFICVFLFDNKDLGFTIASGALAVSVVDLPGPIKYKHNEMLACTFLGALAALITGLAATHTLTLWLTVLPITFFLSMLIVYDLKGPQISFATLYMMIVSLNLEGDISFSHALISAAGLLIGGLWYTYWCFFVSRLQRERIEQQAIAEAIFATAEFMRARACFYEPTTELEENYRELVLKQSHAAELENAARDIVLRNLPRFQHGEKDWRRAMLFNLFINLVDLHDMTMSAHTDYAQLRKTFGDGDVMVFFRDLIHKMANEFENIGLAVLQSRPSQTKLNMKAELRAIEYELERMRKKDFSVKNSEAYAAIASTYRRIWSTTRLIEKMHRNTHHDLNVQDTELKIDKTLSRFLVRRHISFKQFFSNLTTRSPSFRHAVRMTLAIGIGLALGKWLPLTNSYWIVFTIIIILKPGFSLTRQTNRQRLIGTVIGCAMSLAIIYTFSESWLILLIMFASMVMAYSLMNFNYSAAVVFVSAYILLLYHLLAPASIALIGERAIDTAIGGAIALALSYLYANWEYKLMGPLIHSMIKSTRAYIDAFCTLGERLLVNKENNESTEIHLKSQITQGSHSLDHPIYIGQDEALNTQVNAIDKDHQCRLARKQLHVSFANLGQAFLRMMREPKPQQKFIKEINQLLIQTHMLVSQLNASAPLLLTLAMPMPVAINNTFLAIERSLSNAENGENSDESAENNLKILPQALDDWIIAMEQSPETPIETLQELKVLAHQCKQMLKATQLIQQDMAVIKLPA